MPDESPFISEADRNILAAASGLRTPLRQLKDNSEDVYACVEGVQNLLGIAAGSEKPVDRERACCACESVQEYIRELAEFVKDADTAANMLCRMAHDLWE
jgi:hypothetical protein